MTELPPADELESHADDLRLLAEVVEELADEHEKAYDQADDGDEFQALLDEAFDSFDGEKERVLEEYL